MEFSSKLKNSKFSLFFAETKKVWKDGREKKKNS